MRPSIWWPIIHLEKQNKEEMDIGPWVLHWERTPKLCGFLIQGEMLKLHQGMEQSGIQRVHRVAVSLEYATTQTLCTASDLLV